MAYTMHLTDLPTASSVHKDYFIEPLRGSEMTVFLILID